MIHTLLLPLAVRFKRVLSSGILACVLAGGCGLFLGATAGPEPTEEKWVPPFYLEDRNAQTGELERVSMFGPLMEQSFVEPRTWAAFRPFSINIQDESKNQREGHFLYPFYNDYEKPNNRRWDIAGVIRYSQTRSPDPKGTPITHFSIFPIYHYKNTGDPNTSYRGLFPVAGSSKGFMGYKEISWWWFPLYARFDRWGESRVCMPWPFIQWMEGEGCSGGALWPLMGQFKREGRYNRQYMLWPLIYDYKEHLDRPNITNKQGFLPFYSMVDSENVESRTWIWPFFGYTHQTNPFYNESRYFWPFFVQGRGAVDYVNRWAPFYTHSIHRGKSKKWVMWPFLRTRSWDEKGVHIEEGQVFFFLIWAQKQWSLANPSAPPAERSLVWPFISYWDNGAGRKQMQVVNPLEVFFLGNEIVRKVYTPLFALYRYDQIEPGHVKQTLLFNTIVWEKKPEVSRLALGPIVEFRSGKTEEETSGEIRLLLGAITLANYNGKKTLKLFGKEIL